MAVGQGESRAGVIVKMVLVELFWGGTFVGGRIVAGSLSLIDGAALRFFWAATGIIALLFYARAWRPVKMRDLCCWPPWAFPESFSTTFSFLADCSALPPAVLR